MKKPDVLSIEQQDACTPTKEQLEAYLAEPDDPIAAKLRVDDPEMFEIVGQCVVYGNNIAKAQRDDTYEKMLAECCEEIEKVENPFGGKLTLDPEYGAFEQCRKQILARFKEVKDGNK